MNKLEFIVELWKQVDSLCIKNDIKCSKCLDTRKLWSIDKKTDTHTLIICYKCCGNTEEKDIPPTPITKDEEFYGNIGEKQILLFEDRDDTPNSRLEILKEVEKENHERECARIRDLITKRKMEFTDGLTVEKFGKNQRKEFSQTLRYNKLQTEGNGLLQDIVELHGYPWNKKHEIPITFTWPDTYTQGYSYDVMEDENTHPVYLFIILHAHNYMNWLKIIDSCSLFSDEVHVQIKTYVLYPKNDCALNMCNKIIADSKNRQTLLDKLITTPFYTS